jgi:hypothetical protein
MQLTAPPSVSQNVARAKSLIPRQELIRALDCQLTALDNFDPCSLIAKARFEVEANIRQCIAALNMNPQICDLLSEFTHGSKSSIPYASGEEAALRTVLSVLRKALENKADVDSIR